MASASQKQLIELQTNYTKMRQDLKDLKVMVLAQQEQIDFLVTSTVALLHKVSPELFNPDGTPKTEQDTQELPKQPDIKQIAAETVSKLWLPQY
jgi:hypothetical protein